MTESDDCKTNTGDINERMPTTTAPTQPAYSPLTRKLKTLPSIKTTQNTDKAALEKQNRPGTPITSTESHGETPPPSSINLTRHRRTPAAHSQTNRSWSIQRQGSAAELRQRQAAPYSHGPYGFR